MLNDSKTSNKKTTTVNCFTVRKILIFISLIFLLFSCREKERIKYVSGNLNDVFLLSKKFEKKVFILITDSTCGACKQFDELLNRNAATIKTLNNDYICYKANIKNPYDRVIAEVVKCPSYPFPYFFDSDGNLLAFGFPSNKDFSISNLQDFSLDEYNFKEFFKLPITSAKYKELISLNLRGTLLMNKGYKYELEALELFQKSLKIAVYPYNLSKTKILSESLNLPYELKKEQLSTYNASIPDQFIYRDNEYSYFLNKKDRTINDKADFKINLNRQNLGKLEQGKKYKFKFYIKNQSNKLIWIEKASHPCDCIKLDWSKQKVKYNEVIEVSGVFTPYEVGKFDKEIFIHINAENQQMASVFITGIVY